MDLEPDDSKDFIRSLIEMEIVKQKHNAFSWLYYITKSYH